MNYLTVDAVPASTTFHRKPLKCQCGFVGLLNAVGNPRPAINRWPIIIDQEEILSVQERGPNVAQVPRSDLAVEAIDGDLVILDKMQGQIHQLNGTASFVWSAVAAGNTLGNIARKLAERFDVPLDTAATDIEMVVRKFESLNLLTTDR